MAALDNIDLPALVALAADGGGRMDAFAELVRRFQDMAHGCAFGLLGDAQLAEDAAQEAFVEAWRSLDRLHEPGAFPGWFKRIVVHRCHRLLRRRPPAVALEAAGELAADAPSPAALAERRQLQQRVRAAVQALPERERLVTVLYYLDEYSQREIADFLEIGLPAVKNRLLSSRRRLAKGMAKMAQDGIRDQRPSRDDAFAARVALNLQQGQSHDTVHFSPDGRYLLGQTGDENAALWDAASGRRLAVLTGNGYGPSLAFSPDGRYAATGTGVGPVGVWRVPDGTRVHQLQHGGEVPMLAFSPDGRLLATASYDRTAGLWDLDTGRRLATLDHDDCVESVAISPGGKILATGCHNGTAKLWDLPGGTPRAVLQHAAEVPRFAFSPDGKILATPSYDRTVGLWDVGSGRRLDTLDHETEVEGIAFSPDGKLLASGSFGGTAQIWSLA